jgi:uncharacterized protein (DUF58 family)
VRRVEAKPFADYFRSGLNVKEAPEGPFFFVARHLFNPVALLTLFAALLILSGFFSRTSRVVGASLLTFAAVSYLATRASAGAVFIRRRVVKRDLQEGDEVEVVFEIMNGSDFRVPSGWRLEDSFGASLDAFVELNEKREIPPRSRVVVSYRRKCDAGMGTHELGPMRVRVTDALGLFEFRVHEDEVQELHVHPKVQALPLLPVSGSVDSLAYGAYEVASRGLSVNFSGVRPYVPGDSVRHVAWRPSAKRNEGLLVKEFEKVVNCDVTVMLNLDPWVHLGHKSISTWETAKDIALSIVSQQLELGNSVELFSNALLIPAARGEEHFHFISRQVMNLHPGAVTKERPEFLNMVAPQAERIRSGGALFYLSAFDRAELELIRRDLAVLFERGVQVFCVLIDPSSLLHSLGQEVATPWIAKNKSAAELGAARAELELMGIRVYVVREPRRFERAFFERAKGGS